MGRLCFNDVLLCEPRMIDPSMSTGLWWCQSPEDVQAVGVNAVCLSVTGRWEDVKNCGDWLSQFPFVFVASPDRELVEQVRRHVRGLPVLSPREGAFGGYPSITAFLEAHLPSEINGLLYGAVMEPSYGLLELARVSVLDEREVPRTLSGLPVLDKLTGGFRSGELSVWTGKRGEGKSTLLSQILLEAIDQGHKGCAYSGELPAGQFKAWALVQAVGPGHLDLFQDPEVGEQISCAQPMAARRVDEWWAGRYYLNDIRDGSAHDEDRILDEFTYANRVLGCDVFLVDNIMTTRLSGDRDFYRAQSMFTQRLTRFAKAQGVHVHLVAHPRKTQQGKPVTDGDDISGSGDIANLADNVFSVRRLSDEEAENEGCSSLVYVMKVRNRGKRGKVGLEFDSDSCRFYPPGKGPSKAYGWERMGEQTTLVDLGDAPVPFEESGGNV